LIYTTIGYFLLIFFILVLFFSEDLVLGDLFSSKFGLLNSEIIFSASLVPISFAEGFIFDLIKEIFFSS